MTLEEIKSAVNEGKTVYCQSAAYQVIKDSKNQWLIKCSNGHYIGLTWTDEVTMNGKEEDFYTSDLKLYEVYYCYGGRYKGENKMKRKISAPNEDEAIELFKKNWHYEEIYSITLKS